MELWGILKMLCELCSWGGCGIRILYLRYVDPLSLISSLLILKLNRGCSSSNQELIVQEASEVGEDQRLRLIIFNLLPICLLFKLPQLLLLLYVILHV